VSPQSREYRGPDARGGAPGPSHFAERGGARADTLAGNGGGTDELYDVSSFDVVIGIKLTRTTTVTPPTTFASAPTHRSDDVTALLA
jgi:hypothetical protein